MKTFTDFMYEEQKAAFSGKSLSELRSKIQKSGGDYSEFRTASDYDEETKKIVYRAYHKDKSVNSKSSNVGKRPK